MKRFKITCLDGTEWEIVANNKKIFKDTLEDGCKIEQIEVIKDEKNGN